MHFKKIILSDVDGVILNFNDSFIEFVNKRFNKKCISEQVIFYDFKMSLGLSKIQFNRVYNEFIDNNKIEKLKYYSGVIKFFDFLNKKKFKIRLISDIENKVRDKRIKNLSKLRYEHFYENENRFNIVKEYKPMYIFEDRPKYIFKYLKLKEHFKFLFIPIRPYNKKYINQWIIHEQIFVYDNFNKLLKKFRLLEAIYETKKTS